MNELSNFHICWRSPSDIAHDIFEGFGNDLIKTTIEYCVSLNYFNLEYLNGKIRNFTYVGHDKTNKPVELSIDSHKKIVVKETAMQCHCLLRLLPLLIGHKIPEGDPVWELYTFFRQLLDYMLSPSLTRGQIACFENETKDFLQCYFQKNDDQRVKPKAHYMLHYAQQYLTFGPLIQSCTLRFEGKHSFFKDTMRRTKNFKNPVNYLAKKSQFLQCFYHKNENFLPDNGDSFKNKATFVDSSVKDYLEDKFSISTICLYTSASINRLDYSNKHCIVLNVSDVDISFGQVIYISNVAGRSLLVYQLMKTLYFSTHLHAYIAQQSYDESVQSIYISDIKFPFPIPVYIAEQYKVIVLPHFLQTS